MATRFWRRPAARAGSWRGGVGLDGISSYARLRIWEFLLASGRWMWLVCWVDIPASLSPQMELSKLIGTLRGAIWGWSWFLGEPLMMLVMRRLAVISARMERLAMRFERGLLSPRPVATPRVAAAPAGTKRPVAKRIWPYRFGWLLELKRHHAALYTHQLLAVLQRPEMVALLVAAPQAVLILRPLCRMLGIETSVLRPRAPGAPVEVVGVRTVKQRVRPKREPIYKWRIPLPRGVLSAARRQGYGRVPRD